MSKKNLLLLIISILIFRLNVAGQIVTYNLSHSPEYMLPSSETISRIKSVVRPTGLSTGIPNIAVPLFANRYASYSIGLSYHAQGIQVNEEASSVGLGWNLEAGGVIARVVRGIPDETLTKGYLNLDIAQVGMYNRNIGLLTDANSDDLYLTGTDYDPSPDIYYYNFAGIKGKFIIDSDMNFQSIPHNNLKFKKIMSDTGDEIIKFMIITPDGMKYSFSMVERINYTCGSTSFSYNSAWYLSKVSSYSKVHVTYTYEDVIEDTTRNLYVYEYYDEIGTKQSGTVTSDIYITRPQLVKIQDDGSKTEFTYGINNRLEKIDVKAIDYAKLNETIEPYDSESQDFEDDPDRYENWDISKSKILDSYNLFTTIEFNYGEFSVDESFENDEIRTLKLDSVRIGNASKKTYSFTYNSTAIPHLNSKKQDLWGYYNGIDGTTLVPRLNYDSVYYEPIGVGSPGDIVGKDRSVNETTLQAGILTRIENPLGGIVEYKYEPQSFEYDGQASGGGLRIKEILTDDQNSIYPPKTTSYIYTDFNDSTLSTGVLIGKPNFAYFIDNPNSDSILHDTYRYSNYAYGISGYYSNPVFYRQVTTTDGGTGYSVIDFEMPVSSSIFYDQVNNDKLLFLNEPSPDSDGNVLHNTKISYLGKGYTSYFSYDWNTIYVSKKSAYDIDKDTISEVEYNYKDIEGNQYIGAFFASPKLFYSDTDGLGTDHFICSLSKFYYPLSWKLLKSTESRTYEDDEVFSSTSSVEFDHDTCEYRFPIRTETIDVNDNIHFSETKYPYHYEYKDTLAELIKEYEENLIILDNAYVVNYDGELLIRNEILESYVPKPGAIIQSAEEYRVAIETMKARGIASRPIENINGIIIGADTTILSAGLNLYKKTKNGNVGLYEENVLQGPVTYNSFSHSITDTNFHYDPDYQMVRRSLYDLNGSQIGDVSASGVETCYKYTIVGGYLIAKTINTPYSKLIRYTGESEENLREDGDIIITYDYKPLVGKTRETDARGRSVYYIYDTDGKLVATKDNDKNIRSFNSQHIINSTNVSSIDIDTDPDGLDLMETDPGTLTANTFGCAMVTFKINGYNPSYNYFINYDYVSDEVPVEEEIINGLSYHPYSDELQHKVVLRIMKDEFFIEEQSLQVQSSYDPIDVIFSIHTVEEKFTGLDSINIMNAHVELGSGKYNVEWTKIFEREVLQGLHEPSVWITDTTTTTNTEVTDNCSFDFVSETYNTPGLYRIICKVDDYYIDDDPVSEEWIFDIGSIE